MAGQIRPNATPHKEEPNMSYDHRDFAEDLFAKWVDDELGGAWPPIVKEVCPSCNGHGSYVNPSIDAHGLSADDFAEWDEDEVVGYLTGAYDVVCGECKGKNVVARLAPDASPDLKASWEAYQQDWYDYRQEVLAEQRVGA